MDKKSWKEKFVKLSQQVDRYEVDVVPTVKKHDEFTKEWVVSTRSNKESMASVLKKLQSFKNGLSSIQQRLNDFTHAASTADGIQGMLEDFEGRISLFKRNMREDFGRLLEEETRYSDEVDSMAEKIDGWLEEGTIVGRKDSNKSSSTTRKTVQARYEKDLDRQAKIGALDRQLAAIGGRTGGWDNTEHDIFLKIWTQTISNPPEYTTREQNLLIRRACPMLPNKNADEVKDHMQWFMNYLNIVEKKKQILNEWQNDRFVKKRSDEEESAALGQTAGLDLPGSPARRPVSAKARLENKKKLAVWKADKAAKEEEIIKAKEMADLDAKRRARDVIDSRKQANKLKIEQWRKQEAEKSARLAAAKEIATRPNTVDPANIQKQRERDLAFMKKMKEKKDKAEDKRNHRQRRMRELEQQHEYKGEIDITRDMERLLAPTTTYEKNRITKEQREENAKKRQETRAHDRDIVGSGRDLAFGGKARAAWMGGLSHV